MSFLGDAWDITKEAGVFAAEAFEVAGEDTPYVGALINGAQAMKDADTSRDASAAGDADKADYYHDRAGYDMLKAIPGVGSVLGAAELENGAWSALHGKGFKNGMDDVGDSVMDWGAALGIGDLGSSHPLPFTGAPPERADRDDDGMGGNNRHDTWGSHEDLRHRIEDKEEFDDTQKRAQQGG